MAYDCNWKQDEDGVWETECGESFELNEGSPHDNGFRFCMYCGMPLVEKFFEWDGTYDESI